MGQNTTLSIGRLATIAAGLQKPYSLLWRHRELITRVVEITLQQRFLGSMLGVGWLFLAPLTLIGAYAFMFVAVLGIRPPNLTPAQYIAHLSSGLIVYLTMSQCLMAATGALTQDTSLLFNKVFPAELFPVREVLIGLPLLGLGVLVALGWGLASDSLGWAWLWLPVILLLLIQTIIGCAWILSLANLVTKDVAQLLNFLLTLIMLTSPIAYEPTMLPERARFLVDANPVALFIGSVQQIVVHGVAPSFNMLVGLFSISLISFQVGYALFMKGKGIIAESV